MQLECRLVVEPLELADVLVRGEDQVPGRVRVLVQQRESRPGRGGRRASPRRRRGFAGRRTARSSSAWGDVLAVARGAQLASASRILSARATVELAMCFGRRDHAADGTTCSAPTRGRHLAYPFVESPHVTNTGGREIDLIVIHTMEIGRERRYGRALRPLVQEPPAAKVSAHYSRRDSIVQCVRRTRTSAWTAAARSRRNRDRACRPCEADGARVER